MLQGDRDCTQDFVMLGIELLYWVETLAFGVECFLRLNVCLFITVRKTMGEMPLQPVLLQVVC